MSRHDADGLDPSAKPEDSEDLFGEVRDAARALNDALGRLTRSVQVVVGHKTEDVLDLSREGVADSLRVASQQLDAASQRVSAPGSAGHRKRGPKATRDKLVEAGRRVFAAKGYEGASVNDIAAEAGFTKGAFYSTFPSKEALFVEVVTCHAREHPSTSPWSVDLADVPVEDVLLQLEVALYAVRHAEARETLVASWKNQLETQARAVAQARKAHAPTQEDRETAFALAAVTLLGVVTSQALSHEEVYPLVKGICSRLLEEQEE